MLKKIVQYNLCSQRNKNFWRLKGKTAGEHPIWSLTIYFSFLTASPFSFKGVIVSHYVQSLGMVNSGTWPFSRAMKKTNPLTHCFGVAVLSSLHGLFLFASWETATTVGEVVRVHSSQQWLADQTVPAMRPFTWFFILHPCDTVLFPFISSPSSPDSGEFSGLCTAYSQILFFHSS